MAFERSAVTKRLAALLTHEPMEIAQIAAALHVSIAAAHNSAMTLVSSGEAAEERVLGASGRYVRGYRLPRVFRQIEAAERGEYKGEPRPLRYVQRAEPYISLGRIDVS